MPPSLPHFPDKHPYQKLSLALTLFATCAGSIAQTPTPGWPSKPLRIVSPFAPGGGNDTICRLLAHALTPRLGQQVIVENRPGANTLVGTEHVVKSPADGYTFILLPNSATINPHLYPRMPFDVVKDLAPVVQIGTSAVILTVHPSLPVNDMKSFLAFARARPGQLTNGSSGNGSIGHLSGALLDMMAGTSLVHVPYKGTAPAMTDLIGGQIVLSFASALGSVPHIRAGRLRGIAVTNAKRSPALPNLPTIRETVPGYSSQLWYAVFAPAGTPADVISRLNHEIGEVLKLREVNAKLVGQGVDVSGGTAQELGQLVSSELSKWGKVVKASKMKM